MNNECDFATCRLNDTEAVCNYKLVYDTKPMESIFLPSPIRVFDDITSDGMYARYFFDLSEDSEYCLIVWLYRLIQVRNHKKKRINKKWCKRYGFMDRRFIEERKFKRGEEEDAILFWRHCSSRQG